MNTLFLFPNPLLTCLLNHALSTNYTDLIIKIYKFLNKTASWHLHFSHDHSKDLSLELLWDFYMVNFTDFYISCLVLLQSTLHWQMCVWLVKMIRQKKLFHCVESSIYLPSHPSVHYPEWTTCLSPKSSSDTLAHIYSMSQLN